MFCTKCGNAIRVGAGFCSKCGCAVRKSANVTSLSTSQRVGVVASMTPAQIRVAYIVGTLMLCILFFAAPLFSISSSIDSGIGLPGTNVRMSGGATGFQLARGNMASSVRWLGVNFMDYLDDDIPSMPWFYILLVMPLVLLVLAISKKSPVLLMALSFLFLFLQATFTFVASIAMGQVVGSLGFLGISGGVTGFAWFIIIIYIVLAILAVKAKNKAKTT